MQEAVSTGRKLLADEAYERIRYAIFNFLLLPGDRFTEQQLCERLNVSRTPIRQALFRLQQEGHVEVLFRNGWRVLPLDFKLFDALYDFRCSEKRSKLLITLLRGSSRMFLVHFETGAQSWCTCRT